MGTAFSEIITNNFMYDVDDIRLKEDMANNAALTLRRMSVSLINSLPLFNRPVAIAEYVKPYTAPTYDDYYSAEQGAEVTSITLFTGKTGYELCSTGITGIDKFENPFYTSVPNTYDSVTGNVTINAVIPKGTVIQCDFYTDGHFVNELNDKQKRIVGLCMSINWYNHFTNSFLNQQPKVHDASFSIKSENEWVRTTTERRRQMRAELNAEINAYEQELYYKQTTPNSRLIK